jgi:hypothetical protein
MLKQRVFQIACGYEDADDADTLRRDPALKVACERLPEDAALASQPTLSRLENALSRTDLYRIAEVLVEAFIESYRTPPVAILLDIDDTDDTTHGHQQLALFNAFFDEYCYLPIHIYEGRSGKLVTTVLRPGKRPSGKEIVAILKRVVRKIRNAWPEVGILLHALRRCHLQGTAWARAQFDTIRAEVLKIGARVRQLRTRIKVHLPTSYPWQPDWTKIWLSCRGSP